MLGDYNSVQVLPIIDKEVNIEPSEPYRKVASRVELTKRDMQNFLVNGSLSKQFIQSNKKELQKFIKQ